MITFAGRNFRGFADFGKIRESLFREKILIQLNGESLFPRKFIPAKVYSRESLFPRNICVSSHPRKLIPRPLQLENGINSEEVVVKLRLSTLKPLNIGRLIEFYNMTSNRGKRDILSEWQKSGIPDAINFGLSNLPPIDPFNDSDPLVPGDEHYNLIDVVCNLPEEAFSIP